MSQVPDGYDQSAVYRQGLLTQAPMGGPSFASRPVRVGFLGRGRRSAAATAHENQGNVAATSSSPFRASGSDNYSVGSFVVGDEEEIEFEESSQT
ncbi:hypothetical protein FRB91_002333 [Serendipita sp. 411]|nr:hypothetical protein FRB91_002333 [Serendipita sp. 411]